MRAGSAGTSVLGTIQGNSASDVLDRAVEDLGISEPAFSSTDLVVVVGLIRSPDGARFSRRVTEVAEVRPVGGSVDLVPLFHTGKGSHCAKPTEHFAQSARSIAGIADALGVSPDDTMEIIRTKAHADQVSSSVVGPGRSDLTDAASRVRSNEVFTECMLSAGSPESGLKEWLRRNEFDA